MHPFRQSRYEPLQSQRRAFRIFGYYPGDSGFLHWSLVGVFLFHYWSQVQLCYWEFRHGWAKIREGEVFVALEVMTPTVGNPEPGRGTAQVLSFDRRTEEVEKISGQTCRAA